MLGGSFIPFPLFPITDTILSCRVIKGLLILNACTPTRNYTFGMFFIAKGQPKLVVLTTWLCKKRKTIKAIHSI